MARTEAVAVMRDAAEIIVSTPLGSLRVVAGARGIIAAGFVSEAGPRPAGGETSVAGTHGSAGSGDPIRQAAAALRAYFAGERLDALDRVPVDLEGNGFQRRVWRALRGIPAGRVESYGGLARQLGMPEAARAVGLAAAQNPVALFVPCHRLVGSDGALTGYAYGITRKRWLLEHEGAVTMSFAWERRGTG